MIYHLYLYKKNLNLHIFHKILYIYTYAYMYVFLYRMEAKNCLFFMNKLNIKVLPSLCLFIDGVLIQTCVGFEDFGSKKKIK